MKYTTKIFFCLLQYSFILFVSCNQFNMRVLPSEYVWKVSLVCSGCTSKVQKLQTMQGQSDLSFNLETKEKIKKLKVTIKSKEKIAGHERKQTWTLFPNSDNSAAEGRFFNFDKLHLFNFGQFEVKEGENLYLSLEVKNAPPISESLKNLGIKYFALVNNNDGYNDVNQELFNKINGKQITKFCLKEKKIHLPKVLKKQPPKICVAQMFKCAKCGRNKEIYYKHTYDNVADCKACRKSGGEIYTQYDNSVELLKICVDVNNPIFQSGEVPEFTYTIDFNNKKNKTNTNYVKLTNIPLNFHPVDNFDGESSISSGSKSRFSSLRKSYSSFSFRKSSSSLSSTTGSETNVGSEYENEGRPNSTANTNENGDSSGNSSFEGETSNTAQRKLNKGKATTEMATGKAFQRSNTMPPQSKIPMNKQSNSSNGEDSDFETSDDDVEISLHHTSSFNGINNAKPPMPEKKQSVTSGPRLTPIHPHPAQTFNTPHPVPAPYWPYTNQGNFGNTQTSNHGNGSAGYHGSGLGGSNVSYMQPPNNNSAYLHPHPLSNQAFQSYNEGGVTSSHGHPVAGQSHGGAGYGGSYFNGYNGNPIPNPYDNSHLYQYHEHPQTLQRGYQDMENSGYNFGPGAQENNQDTVPKTGGTGRVDHHGHGNAGYNGGGLYGSNGSSVSHSAPINSYPAQPHKTHEYPAAITYPGYHPVHIPSGNNTHQGNFGGQTGSHEHNDTSYMTQPPSMPVEYVTHPQQHNTCYEPYVGEDGIAPYKGYERVVVEQQGTEGCSIM